MISVKFRTMHEPGHIEVNPRLRWPRSSRVWLALMVALAWCLFLVQTTRAAECPPGRGLVLQVLGSGGPVADDDRASSAYLVWHDGRARVLVDAFRFSNVR